MRTPINDGILQSDLDVAGFNLLNFSGGGGGTSRKFDVKTYGAEGDGTTDDTTAIQDALAAIPVEGGVLYFPAGVYLYAGTTLTLDRQITVEGDGGGNRILDAGPPVAHVEAQPAISTIDFASSTGTLFTVTADGCTFKNLGLRNTSVTEPTAGAGILVLSRGDRTRYDSITVDGFYIDIDVQAGTAHVFDNCYIDAPVLYGLKLRNILVPDGGDHAISNCYFYNGRSYPAVSAIRIESGGGVKIINTKIVYASLPAWVNGIDLAVGDGVVTVDLLISNCSIEGYSGCGFKGTTGASSFWREILLTGNQFMTVGASGYGINLSATTAGDFGQIVITGNQGFCGGSSSPFIHLANCSDVTLANNQATGFGDIVTFGSGVTFAERSQAIPAGGTTGQLLMKLGNLEYDVGWATPTTLYIGTDMRLVAITGGAKLQVRNPGTGLWADADQWTNP